MRFRANAFAVLVAATIGARARQLMPGQIPPIESAANDSLGYTCEDRLARDAREPALAEHYNRHLESRLYSSDWH